jgi:hypothetical protein
MIYFLQDDLLLTIVNLMTSSMDTNPTQANPAPTDAARRAIAGLQRLAEAPPSAGASWPPRPA